MKTIPTPLEGVVVLEPDVYKDARGFFLETYHQDKYAALGVPGPFVQDNHSRSAQNNAARTLHAQLQTSAGQTGATLVGEILTS